MEQDKTKILSDLYAIRATMSVVAENDDAVEVERGEIGETEVKIESARKSFAREKYKADGELKKLTYETYIERAEHQLKDAREALQKAKRDFEYTREKKEKQYEESKHSFKHYFTLVGGDVWLIYCGVDAGIWFVLFLITTFMGLGGTDIFFIIVFALPTPIVLFVVHPIVYLIMWGKGMSEYKDYVRQNYNPSKAEFEKCQREVNQLEADITQYRAAIARGEIYALADEAKEILAEISEQERQCQSDIALLQEETLPHKATIRTLSLRSQAIVESATKAYPLIDFRDWENVDLIIYYFETGRADDMKEALQLVDRQRQTDEITSAIAMASAAICKTIDSSIARLGMALKESFKMLSLQMARQHGEMMYRMEQQAELQRETSEAQSREIRGLREQAAAQSRELRGLREQATAEMSMQVSAQAMNAALLNKISVSSKRLADQMDRQMREVHGLY